MKTLSYRDTFPAYSFFIVKDRDIQACIRNYRPPFFSHVRKLHDPEAGLLWRRINEIETHIHELFGYDVR